MRMKICAVLLIVALLFLTVHGNDILRGSEDAEVSYSDTTDKLGPVAWGALVAIGVMVVSIMAANCEDDHVSVSDPHFQLVGVDDGIHVGDKFTVEGSFDCYPGKPSHCVLWSVYGRVGPGGDDWDWTSRDWGTFMSKGGDVEIEFEFTTRFGGRDFQGFQAMREGQLVVEARVEVWGFRGSWWCWDEDFEIAENPGGWVSKTSTVLAPYQWDLGDPEPDDEVYHTGSPTTDDTTATLKVTLTSKTEAKLKGDLYMDGKTKSFELTKGQKETLSKKKGCPEVAHPQTLDYYFEDIRGQLKIDLINGECWEQTVEDPDEPVTCKGYTEMEAFSEYWITWGDIEITPPEKYEGGAAVSFNLDLSGDEPPGVQYTWHFSDGSTSTDMPTTRTYDDECLDTVVLVAEWPIPPGSAAESAYVHILNQNPIIETISVVDSEAVGETVDFEATASDAGVNDTLTYRWFFGDGDSASGSPVTHAYPHYGNYRYSLIVEDGDDGFDASGGLIRITGEIPVADGGGPYSGDEGSRIVFDGAGSTDPDGDITLSGWIWHFGDGDSGYGTTTTHTYADDGTYYATLIVTDDNTLRSAPDAFQVIVNDVDPVFRRVAVDYQTQYSVRLCADYDSPNPLVDTLICIWAFGDGYVDTGKVSYHEYDPGSYDITLRVQDEDSYVETTWAVSIPVDQNSVSSFTLDVYPSYQEVWPGESTTYACSLTSINNFSSPCTMSVEGLPFGADSAFTGLHSKHPFAWITLECTTDLYTTYGIYELTVRGKGGGKEATAVCTLEVGGACDTTLEVLPGGLFAYYFWKQPPEQFLNMQFEMPLDLGGRLQSFNIAFWGDAATGTPDPDFYVWPSDGTFPQDENPPSGAIGDYHLSYDSITWYPGQTTIQAYFHDLVFDPGEVFHIGFSHANEPGDTLAILSDDGSMGSERSSGWNGSAWVAYSPYEFLIDAVICPIAPTFTMEGTPPLAVIAPGDQWVDLYDIEVESVVGYAHNVTLSLMSVSPPENISASFTPNGVPTPYISDVAISVDAAVPEGDYILTFQGLGDDAQTKTCDVTLRVQWPLICGDCARSGIVDLGDAVYLLNYLFKGGTPPDPLCLGDVNCDAIVDIADVIYVINYLFKGDDPPCQECCFLKARTEKSPIQTIERDSQPIRRNPQRIPQAPGDLKRIR